MKWFVKGNTNLFISNFKTHSLKDGKEIRQEKSEEKVTFLFPPTHTSLISETTKLKILKKSKI